MASAKSQNTKPGDQTVLILIPIVLFGVVWVLWHRERPVIVTLIYAFVWWQYALMHLIHWLGPHGEQMYQYVSACMMRRIDLSTVSWNEVVATEMDVGHRARFPMVVIGAICTYLIMTRMTGEGLMRRFNMSGFSRSKVLYWGLPKMIDRKQSISVRVPSLLATPLQRALGWLDIGRFTLGSWMKTLLGFYVKSQWIRKDVSFMEFQARVWPVTLSGARFDPNRDDPSRRQSDTPPEWMLLNGVTMTAEGKVNDEEAEAAFRKQLGKPWTGVDFASLHVKAIMVSSMLILMKGGTDKSVTSFRDQVAVAFTSKNYKAVRALVDDKLKGRLKEKIEEVAAKHAYTNTALLGVMGYCGAFPDWGGGEGSINAPAFYNWLKGIDRLCFYVIQQHGRKKYFVESAGAVSHFQVEYMTRGAVNEPYMDSAIIGLESYLEEHSIQDLSEYFRRRESRRK